MYTGRFFLFPAIPLQDILSFVRKDTLLSLVSCASKVYLKVQFLFQHSNFYGNKPPKSLQSLISLSNTSSLFISSSDIAFEPKTI